VGRSWAGFLKIGLLFLALTIPFNTLSVHLGRIILFRLPGGWPIIGGPITLEAVLAGVLAGLSLLTIVVIFAVFNSVVNHYELLRATPPFLFQAGVVISIAITFVPQMVISAREIREAQRIRGHRFRGIRDLLPVVLPLLANGLERAIQLAETMEARGFGSAVSPRSHRRTLASQAITLASLLGLLAGLLLNTYVPEHRAWAWMLIGLSLAALVANLVQQGRQVRVTRYRRSVWTWRDTAVVAASGLVIATILTAKALVPKALTYSPFPPNSLLPPFEPLLGVVLLALTLPAILAPRAERETEQTTECVT
jgi:energy-coupling factor transport system permease protein